MTQAAALLMVGRVRTPAIDSAAAGQERLLRVTTVLLVLAGTAMAVFTALLIAGYR